MKTDGTLSRTMAIIMPGQRLVAAGQADQRVVAMAAHGELDRIGDDLARDQRGFHALVAHGDAVGHGDGGELARRAAGGLDAQLHRLGLAAKRDVAGRGLVPAVATPTSGWWISSLGQAHGVEIGAVRRPLRADRDVAAGQLRLVVPTFGRHVARGHGLVT